MVLRKQQLIIWPALFVSLLILLILAPSYLNAQGEVAQNHAGNPAVYRHAMCGFAHDGDIFTGNGEIVLDGCRDSLCRD